MCFNNMLCSGQVMSERDGRCDCRDASCIVSLTRQFSNLSSVPKTPMNQIEGALAHAESLEMHTMSSTELRKTF